MKLFKLGIIGILFCTAMFGNSKVSAAESTSEQTQQAQDVVAQDRRLVSENFGGMTVYRSKLESSDPTDTSFDIQQATDDYQIKPKYLRSIPADKYPNALIFGSVVKLDMTGFYEFFSTGSDVKTLKAYTAEFDAKGNLLKVTPNEEGKTVLLSGLRSSDSVARAKNVIEKYCTLHNLSLAEYYDKNKETNPMIQEIVESGASEVTVRANEDTNNYTFKLNYVDVAKGGDLSFDLHSAQMNQYTNSLNRKYAKVSVNEKYLSDGRIHSNEYVIISGRTVNDLVNLFSDVWVDYLQANQNATLTGTNIPVETSQTTEILPQELQPGTLLSNGTNGTFLNELGAAKKYISGNTKAAQFGLADGTDWDTLGKAGTTFQKITNSTGTTDSAGIAVSPTQKGYAGLTTYNALIFDPAMGAKRASEKTYFSGIPKLSVDAYHYDFSVEYPAGNIVDPRPPANQ
ncbi:hypothetical protein ESZ50_02410 [Weissella muntiaci]|uniref:Uncharacterized protein n=1 Tax=Weissella muntiaci TaxID=2508881 RepID=A0A6C2C938_9LACO|nr:hypothetical protein [Weissella muntiaci]TYC50541.1 hypothetical protein ESZ50_02410 [Weissella muntiaci]